MRSYDLGNPEIDAKVKELVAEASTNGHQDLIAEIVTTALKLHRDGAIRGDLKLINTALKEMRYSMAVFARHDEPKVTMFGSSRLKQSDPNYELAVRFAALMAARGWGVVTGAGPGIMEAGNRGAGKENSYGVSIRLPFEPGGNGFLDPTRVVNFKYFFTRKLGFVKESHAFALFPGGFGTLDETFELLTLMQTGKSDLHPIVMVEAPGTGYWERFIEFVKVALLEPGMIGSDDLHLFRFCTDEATAVDELCRFYANYQSQRYVEGLLVLRLKVSPSLEEVALLNEHFADIVAGPPLQVAVPSPVEMEDDDQLSLARVSLGFDRRSYGRLRQLIDRLNTLVNVPEIVNPPNPSWEDLPDQG
jgi:uncharacterized protein (TIGR00730 family)